MRELKLRYMIDLASNIGQKSREDAQALEQAQKIVQGAITGTNSKLTNWNALSAKAAKDTALLQATLTGTSNKFTDAGRAIGQMDRAAARVTGTVTGLDRVLTRVGTNTSTERQGRYMRDLGNETDRATNRLERFASVHKAAVAASVIGGVAAAGRVLKDPVVTAMSYDRRLASMANTAYADRDATGRIQGMKALEAAINAARRQGGGTREQGAEALDTMIASGVISNEDSMLMLPGIIKAAVASDASPKEIATIAIRARQSFKIPAKDIPALLSSAMAAGMAGGFELKDMAKWLPQQMAMAGNLGMSGKEGFAKLAAWNQASVITAGTKDEAGNNLRDLLNELNTPHFRDFMAKELLNGGNALKKGEKKQKQQEIDDVFLGYQERGVDKVSATVDLLDKLLTKDKRYAALQKRLGQLPAGDADGRREVLEAMAAQVQGTATGKIFHNQQSLMAFLALSNNRDYTNGVLAKVRGEQSMPVNLSAVGIAHEVVKATADFKVEQGKEDSKIAEKAAIDKMTPTIGRVADKFGAAVTANPEVAGNAILGAKAAAASIGIATLLSFIFGARALKVAGGAATAEASGGAASAAAAASGASRAAMLARSMSMLNPLMLIEMLTGPSESDIEKLREMDRQKAGYRGRGFDDPRRLDAMWDKKDPEARQAAMGGIYGQVGGATRFTGGLAAPQLDLLTLTAPGMPSTGMRAGSTTELKVGEGTLNVDVRVTDDRVLVTPSVSRPLSLIRINPGNTNPGSLKATP